MRSDYKKVQRNYIISFIVLILTILMFKYFSHSNIQEFGLNSNNTQLLGNAAIDIEQYTLVIGFIFSLISLLVLFVLSKIYRKWFVRKVEQKYPDEKIIYTHLTHYGVIRVMFWMLPGFFFGTWVFPFFVSQNLTHIDMVNNNNYLLFALFSILLAYFCLFATNTIAVLTNKRFVRHITFLKMFTDNFNTVPVENIVKIQLTNYVAGKYYDFISQDNNFVRLYPLNNKKEADDLIDFIKNEQNKRGNEVEVVDAK